MSFTPMIRQYLDIKQKHPGALLFFRLGDFYEMFFEDAQLAARELEITLTGREGGGKERIPMCGVPYHAAEGYIAKLIDKGYRVAICEQVEDPAEAKGIVRREVIRVITPGTVMDSRMLEDKNNNYLACVAPGRDGFGLAVTDISTGAFLVTACTGAKAKTALSEELARLKPAELLAPAEQEELLNLELNYPGQPVVTGYRMEAFAPESARANLSGQFGDAYSSACPLADLDYIIPAAGALLLYLQETQKRGLEHLNHWRYYQPERCLILDAATRRNLELTRSLRESSKRYTLLRVLDHTVTAMGGRLLKNWIEQPLLDRREIEARLDGVGELTEGVILRHDLAESLKGIYDLERLSGRISFGNANARDMVALRRSLERLPELKYMLAARRTAVLRETGNGIDILTEARELLTAAIEDEPPLSLREGGLIRPGFNDEVDRLRLAGRDGKNMLAGLEERERARTGIKSLKVGYNRVFGYYIEVTKSNLGLAPGDYQRKQTLANAERFITAELKEYEDAILGATERLTRLEYHLFEQVRQDIAAMSGRIQTTAAAVARADAIYSLAEAAAAGQYVRPAINEEGRIRIREGRHPVLENVLGQGCFVPNDTVMDRDEQRLLLLTGPNMAGKSTYLRQVALIVLMAQVGSFVPAGAAETCLVDRIFTRIGAADDLAGGQSTFMMEMNECRDIVAGATADSLIIMDEVGRGTSTYDGISIARSLVEYIHLRVRAKTLFSTHYHELTDLEAVPGIVNYNVAVDEQGAEIVFLRRVAPGKANRSYGIHVAGLAGLPDEIIERANDILSGLEEARGGATVSGASTAGAAVDGEVAGLAMRAAKLPRQEEHPALLDLRRLEITRLTPIEAINELDRLQRMANSQ